MDSFNNSVQKNFFEIIEDIAGYNIVIVVLPLLGYLASLIYSTKEAEEWYSSIQFYIPDITTQNYGLYVSAYFFILVGVALSLLYTGTINRPSTKSYLIWLIPVILLMIYIANPIMYQSQSTIAAAVIYTISTILAFIVLYYIYSIAADRFIKISWIIFIIWLVYLTIFFYTGGSGAGRLASALGFREKYTELQDNCVEQPVIVERPVAVMT